MNAPAATPATEIHPFEKAGLGKAPFKVVGFAVSKFQAAPGESVKPGSSCDYCGTAIMNVFMVAGRDGCEFKVGCDCVARTGDGKLYAEVKAARRAARVAHRDNLRKAAREKREIERREQFEQELRVLYTTTPELSDALKLDHPIIREFQEVLQRGYMLTEKQVELACKLYEQSLEVKVDAPVSDKRQSMRGVLVSKKLVEGQYGNTWKGTVKVTTVAGVWFAWGTLPNSVCYDAETGYRCKVGDELEFDALLVATGNDESFAFFKRPTKAKVVKQG